MTTNITFFTTRGTVTYTTKTALAPIQPGAAASGLIGGEPTLVAIVQEILGGRLPKRVRVSEPNLDYEFSATRDTLADIAAAMLVAGNGKGRLCDTGWEVLDTAMEGHSDGTDPKPTDHRA